MGVVRVWLLYLLTSKVSLVSGPHPFLMCVVGSGNETNPKSVAYGEAIVIIIIFLSEIIGH